MIWKPPCCPHVLAFDASMKAYWSLSNRPPTLAWGAAQGPGQEYSSDQSEQCCVWSRQRLLGTQPQYPKTVEGQSHQPGPQGGHAVTAGTAEEQLLRAGAPLAPHSPTPSDTAGRYSLFPCGRENLVSPDHRLCGRKQVSHPVWVSVSSSAQDCY